MNAAKFYVSRQRPYYAGVRQVEVAQGGCDYAGADALTSGLNQEFDGMVPALAAAIEDARAWKRALKARDADDCEVYLAVGGTCGILTEIDADCEIDDAAAVARLEADAEQFDAALPRCDECGDILGRERYTLVDEPECGEFCSMHCAERAEIRYHTEDGAEEDAPPCC